MADHFSEYDAYSVPPEFRPIGAWGYFGLTLLFSLPVIGLIFLIVFSFSDANINRRNYARSYFCVLFISLVLLAVAFFTGMLATAVEYVSSGQLVNDISKIGTGA